jgi:hypothetical protein
MYLHPAGQAGLFRSILPFFFATGVPGSVNEHYWVGATGAHFAEMEERGVTNTGAITATSDDEIGKMGPVPSGCGENPLRRRCRPLIWNHRTVPVRLA